MAKQMELGIIITAGVSGALMGMAKTGKALQDLGNKYKKLAEEMHKNKVQEAEIKKMEQLTKSYVSAGKEWVAAVAKLRKLKEAYDKNGQSNAKLAEKIKQQEKAVEKLTTKKLQAERAYRQSKSAIEAEHGSLKKYREEVEKTTESIERQQKLKKISENYKKRNENLDKISSYGDKAARVSAVTGAMTLAPIKIFMDVEESQADLRKMLGDEAQKYYGALREISDKSPLSQPEVFEIAGSLAQSGIKGDEIVEYTKRANQLKVAFDMTTQESGQFLAKTKEQLGLTKDELFRFTDTINYMSDNTASTAAQLAEFSQRVGSVARTANLSKEANIAFGATLISMGTNTEIAATGIKQLYLELGKGADTKKKANALQSLGINGDTLARDMAKDAEGTILKVLEKIKNANAGDKIGLLTDIFGEQAANSVATLANNTDKLRENLVKSKSEMANGAVEKEYASRMNTLSNQLKMGWNKVKNALADLGASLAPTIRSLLEQATPFIEKMAQWVKQNPKLTGGIMKVIAAVALLSGGLALGIKVGVPLFKTFNLLYTGFSKLNVLFSIGPKLINVFRLLSSGVVKAVLGIGKAFMGIVKVVKIVGMAIKTAFLANPVGVIIIAIIAVIAIFVLLYNKCAGFRNFVNNMWKSISDWAIKTWNKIKPAVLAFVAFALFKIRAFIHQVQNNWAKISQKFKQAMEKLKPIVTAVLNVIIAIFKVYIRTTANTFKLIMTVARGVFKMIGSYIKIAVALWKGIFQIFVAFFTGKWNEIPGIVSKVWESVKSGISGFVDGAKTILKGLFDWFGSQWENIKKGGADLVKAINPLNWGKNYSGTNYWSGGLTTVAERGAELIKIPGQSPFVAQSEMLLNLPRGTQILNNSQTRNSLRDRVGSLKEKVSNLKNSNNSFGGDNITIQIIGGNNNPMDIAKEVRRELERLKNKKERTAFG